MKTITRSVLVAFFVCGGVLGASAQTQEQLNYIERNSDFTALKELAVKFDTEFQENYQKALVLAGQNGWPLTINKPDGGFSELVGVSEDGRPMYNTTSNFESAITSRVNTLYPGGAAGLSLDGTGMLAGVWDAGKPRLDHVDLVDSQGNVRITPADGSTAIFQEHSTHVMGTILSSGINNKQAKGMAYNASGVWADWTNDKAEMATAAKKGLLVSNHSYGLDAKNIPVAQFGAYIQGSYDLDALMFSAPFYQPCWAAGNDRAGGFNSTKGGYDLLSDEATAKNVIVVAAVEKVLSYTKASDVVMSSFSNWGPTDDSRIKPDISDKGVDVYSTVETSTTAYAKLSGTSMATPGVVGALVLLQQHYGNLNSPAFMRSATLRGLVAHTADEAGPNPGPDAMFGWGLINAQRAAKAISDSKEGKSIINEMTLATGSSYTTTVVATGNDPLVATISWTDRPGTINTNGGTIPVLVNDLDIRVTKDGVATPYMPWGLVRNNPSVAAVNNKDNAVDNIEKIEVQGATAGIYTITVTHKGTLVGGSQDFSLIVTGITDAPLGIDEANFKMFNVWPNPANDLLNVSIQSDLSVDAFVTVYDILGKRVVDQKLDAANSMFEGSLNIGSLNPGMYLVKVSQGNKQSVRKIIKK